MKVDKAACYFFAIAGFALALFLESESLETASVIALWIPDMFSNADVKEQS
jgi:hypothetical protein